MKRVMFYESANSFNIAFSYCNRSTCSTLYDPEQKKRETLLRMLRRLRRVRRLYAGEKAAVGDDFVFFEIKNCNCPVNPIYL